MLQQLIRHTWQQFEKFKEEPLEMEKFVYQYMEDGQKRSHQQDMESLVDKWPPEFTSYSSRKWEQKQQCRQLLSSGAESALEEVVAQCAPVAAKTRPT